MARIESDPNYSSPTFSRATAATDPFKKEDVQNLAAAVSTHDHSTGKGVAVPFATAIPNGTITSAMIADATIDTADLKDGAVTSAKIFDGTIATADLANSAVTNAKLGSDTARANLLTNGGFEIWQRGNGPFTTNGAYSVDRWAVGMNAPDTISVSKNTANCDTGSMACAAVTTVHSGAGNAYLSQDLRIGADGNQLAGKTISVSVRVNASVSGVASLRVDDNIGQLGISATNTVVGSYQTLSVTVTPAVNATNVRVYLLIVGSATTYWDNAMLVVGSVPADYAPLHPADDLARCLRYYEVFGGESSNEYFAAMQCYSTTQGLGMLAWKAPKAVVPTVTLIAAPGSYIVTGATASAIALTAFSSSALTRRSAQITVTTASGLVAGNASMFQTNSSGSIAIEANP